MTSLGQLYVFNHEFNPRYNKIRAVAKFAGLTFEQKDPIDTEAYYKECSPMGRHPSLVTPEGALFESNAIVRHIARASTNGLYGKTNYEAGQVDQWLDFTANELDGHAFKGIAKALGFGELADDVAAAATASLIESFTGLELWLESRTYLVGERITAADIVVATSVDAAFRFLPDSAAEFRKFKNVVRFYTMMYNQPEYLAALDDKHPKTVANLA